jgi:hypothetical protein
MLVFALSGIVIGLLLRGLTVAAVVPAIIVVLLISSAIGALSGDAWGFRLVEAGSVVIGLQLGYLVGSAMRLFWLHRVTGASKSFRSLRPRSPSAGINTSLHD